MADYLYECQYGDIRRYKITSKTAKTVIYVDSNWGERRIHIRPYHFFSFEDAVAYRKIKLQTRLEHTQKEVELLRLRLSTFDSWVADKKKSFETAGEPK